MENAKIVTGSTIQLDYAALGYSAVGSIYFRVKPQFIDESINRILKFPDVYSAVKLENNTAVNVVATLKTIEEFNRLKEITLRLSTASELSTNIWLGIRNIPHNLQITKIHVPIRVPAKRSNREVIDLDEVDKQIIEKLTLNGRSPFAKVAQDIGIATNTVIRKYQRLKNNGVINVSIQVNPVTLGYHASGLFNLAFVSQSNLPAIVDKLSLIPNVYLMIKTSGQFDLSVYSLIKDIEQFLDIQNRIAEIADISKSQTFIRPLKRMLPGPKEYISTF